MPERGPGNRAALLCASRADQPWKHGDRVHRRCCLRRCQEWRAWWRSWSDSQRAPLEQPGPIVGNHRPHAAWVRMRQQQAIDDTLQRLGRTLRCGQVLVMACSCCNRAFTSARRAFNWWSFMGTSDRDAHPVWRAPRVSNAFDRMSGDYHADAGRNTMTATHGIAGHLACRDDVGRGPRASRWNAAVARPQGRRRSLQGEFDGYWSHSSGPTRSRTSMSHALPMVTISRRAGPVGPLNVSRRREINGPGSPTASGMRSS